jgi:hypothetical protein
LRLRLRLPLAALVTVAAAVALALAVLAADPGELRDRIAGAEQRERSLDGQIAELDAAGRPHTRALTIIEGPPRRGAGRPRPRRGPARRRGAGPRGRAAAPRAAAQAPAEVRELLGRRLVTRYKAPTSTCSASSSTPTASPRSWSVPTSCAASSAPTRTSCAPSAPPGPRRRPRPGRLAVAEARQREVVGGLRLRRNALASMSAQVAARKATLERVRSARAAALDAARGDRRRLQSRPARRRGGHRARRGRRAAGGERGIGARARRRRRRRAGRGRSPQTS